MRSFADLFQAVQARAAEAVRTLARNPVATMPAFTAPAPPSAPAAPAGKVPSPAPDPFENWFQSVNVTMAAGLPGSYVMNRAQTASEEGAREALRLVQQFEPGARLQQEYFSCEYFTSDNPVFYVELPNGARMNAGLILEGYYVHGNGADAVSENNLASEIELLTKGAERA